MTNNKKNIFLVSFSALLGLMLLSLFPIFFSSPSITGAIAANTPLCKTQLPETLLLFGSGDNYLYALDAITGMLIWKSDATRDIEYGAPAVSKGKVYIGTRNRFVQAFDLETGMLLWKTTVKGRVYGTPVVYDDKVYVGVGDGILYAFEADTGELLWQFATGSDEKTSDIYSSVVFSNGILYVSAYDGKIYAVDIQGNLLWTFATNGKLYASARIIEDTVYVASGDGNIYALDAKTGKRLWKASLPSSSGEIFSIRTTPAYSDEVLYIAAHNGQISALDVHSVEILWQTDLGSIVSMSSPFVTDDFLYVGAYDGKLYTIDRKTGEIAWTFATQGRIYASPVIEEGIVYIGSGDYHMYAIDAMTGELLWKYKTGSTVNGAATIVHS